MSKFVIAAIAGACSLAALVQPAVACPAGYHTVWKSGHPICVINLPNLPLKAKSGVVLKK